MEEKTIDKRFYKEAINTLKSFGPREFTVRFLKIIGLPVKGNLDQMWDDIEDWLKRGNDSDCIRLLEYVDELKMWGKQRIYLFTIENEDTIEKLSDDQEISRLERVGRVYNNPVYEWELNTPTLVWAKKKVDFQSKETLLILKFIELREFKFVVDGIVQTSEERSTNYFIINLTKGYAELRLQQLPTGANLKYKEEYIRFMAEISNCLGESFNSFKPISFKKVLPTIIQKPLFSITGITFVSGKKSSLPTSTLLLIINRLFSNPRVSFISSYWRCKQEILGRSRLYFSLSGNSNSINIGGIADPKKIRELLQKIVNIHKDIRTRSGPIPKPIMDNLYFKLYGHPKAQAIVLSAGAVAAFLIWIIMDGVGNYLFEEGVQKFLGSTPIEVPKIIIEIIWILAFYGWKRTLRSFIALRHLSPTQIWKTIMEAKKNKKLIAKKIFSPISSHYD